jgi:L,D-transpeptidase ErfK/SrfK
MARMIAQANLLFACLLAGIALPALAGELPPLSRSVTGGDTEYTVPSGIAIGARFGVAAKVLAQHNAILYEAIIHPGQSLPPVPILWHLDVGRVRTWGG